MNSEVAAVTFLKFNLIDTHLPVRPSGSPALLRLSTQIHQQALTGISLEIQRNLVLKRIFNGSCRWNQRHGCIVLKVQGERQQNGHAFDLIEFTRYIGHVGFYLLSTGCQ